MIRATYRRDNSFRFRSQVNVVELRVGARGPVGPQGEPGTPGAGVTWRGAWAAGSYAEFDAVEHQGSSWIANAATTDEPGVGAGWDLWVQKGDPGATGPQGPEGPQGPTGATGPEGPQGPAGAAGADALWNFLGAYDNGFDYQPGDVVTHLGSTWYRSGEANVGYAPPNPDYWTLVAAKGETGDQGPQGEQGPEGPAGATGATGATGPQGPAGATGATGATGPAGAGYLLTVTSAEVIGPSVGSKTFTHASTTTAYAIGQRVRVVASGGTGTWMEGELTATTATSKTVLVDLTAGAAETDTWQITVTGEQGPTGETGPQGPEGPAGAEGPEGPAGATGATGATGAAGADGNDGWSPVLAVVADGERRVLQVSDWQGGEGTKPATGKYVGSTGLVDLIANGVDIRGAAGAAGSGVGAKHVVLGADVTITDNTTLQNITGLAASLEANKHYQFQLRGIVVTSAAGTGYALGLTGPTSPDFWEIEARLYNGAAGASTPGMLNHLLGFGLIAQNANGSVAGVNVTGNGSIKTGANAGSLQFQTRVETGVTGSVVWKAGSRVIFSETTA